MLTVDPHVPCPQPHPTPAPPTTPHSFTLPSTCPHTIPSHRVAHTGAVAWKPATPHLPLPGHRARTTLQLRYLPRNYEPHRTRPPALLTVCSLPSYPKLAPPCRAFLPVRELWFRRCRPSPTLRLPGGLADHTHLFFLPTPMHFPLEEVLPRTSRCLNWAAHSMCPHCPPACHVPTTVIWMQTHATHTVEPCWTTEHFVRMAIDCPMPNLIPTWDHCPFPGYTFRLPAQEDYRFACPTAAADHRARRATPSCPLRGMLPPPLPHRRPLQVHGGAVQLHP